MVRVVFIIVLTSIYLLLTVGVGKASHSCLGKNYHTSLFSFEALRCACSANEGIQHCCADDVELIKIENKQTLTQIVQSNEVDYILIRLLAVGGILELELFQQVVTSWVSNFLPPPKIPIYQSVCSLIFYQ